MHVLPHLNEYHCHPCVLADGYHVLSSNFQVFFQLAKDLASQRRLLFLNSQIEYLLHIPGKHMVCLNAHFLNRFRDQPCVYLPHGLYSSFNWQYVFHMKRLSFRTAFSVYSFLFACISAVAALYSFSCVSPSSVSAFPVPMSSDSALSSS